jgi:4-hydroxybenzoate polyprenyltransferase/phosphoserine phosphatase
VAHSSVVSPRRDPRPVRLRDHVPAPRASVAPGPEISYDVEVERRPLVVDLDGTLVRSDLLIESGFAEIGRNPASVVAIVRALKAGKAALKHHLADAERFDPATLPYDDEVLARIHQARAEGRPVYLASASNERLVEAVAEHLGLFTGAFGSDETVNLAGPKKAARLVAAFGEAGFDYIGNDAADLAVWARAARAITVRARPGVVRRLVRVAPDCEHLPCTRPTWRTWAKLIRVHQWAKNALVFLALLASHTFEWHAAGQALLAAVAFSLCASSVYLLNDLVDLQDDRSHWSKRRRPLASGAIPLMHGVVAMPFLLAASLGVAALVSMPFLAVLLGYFALTTAYSFVLKRKMLVDVVTLGALYSMRVLGGAVAIDVVASKWLLGFCMCIFMSLALIKRYVELAARHDAKMPDPSNRDYRTSDLPVVLALAAAAGFNAVTVFALYISSDGTNQLYSRPEILWLVCPVLIYWIGRALMLAHRREMDDDPVVFALKDRISLASVGAAAALVLAAI